MRYAIISLETLNGLRWVNQTVATLHDREGAIAVGQALPIPCYVVDRFANQTIWKS